jgi:hypothetical protein
MESRKAFLSSHLAKAKLESKTLSKRSRVLSWFRLSLIIALLLISYWAFQEAGADEWLWAWLPGIVLFLALVQWHLKVRASLDYQKALASICEEDLAALEGRISRAAFAYRAPAGHPFARELDLFGTGSLHHHMDRSFTLEGAQALAADLMDPPYADWKERQDYFSELEADPDWTLDYRAQGNLLEEKPKVKERLGIWAEESFTAFPKWYWLPMVAGIAAVWYYLFGLVMEPSPASFQSFLIALTFNLAILGSRSKVLRKQHHRVGQVSDLMSSFTLLIHKLEARDFKTKYAQGFLAKFELKPGTSAKLKELSGLLSSLDQSANAVALVVLNGLFHYHLFRLRRLEIWHRNNAKHLSTWLSGLHRFESHLSIVNYQANHPDFNYPHFTATPHLEAQALGHPLINPAHRVSNPLQYQGAKYIILTGSNMSGKSTFLRSIGINLVLAQLGTKVCAKEFKTYPFQLLSSMNPQDDLRAETSYFQAEILRLRSLLDRISEQRFSFFLLDEILRGTNSDDKQEGTRGFLKQIEGLSAWGIIATHDVDIAHLADQNPNFWAAYFESQVIGEELNFDYKLRKGICKTPNASLLMKRYGLIPEGKS